MKVLAIMQNQYFDDPDRVRLAFHHNPSLDFRARFIARCLFAGCKSGRVLKRYLGEWTDKIIWDEASSQIGGNSKSCFPADPGHVGIITAFHKPDVMLAFGNVADKAAREVAEFRKLPYWSGPHPAGRNPVALAGLSAVVPYLMNMQSMNPQWK